MSISRRTWLAAAVVGPSAVVTTAWAQPGMPPLDPPSVKQQIQDGRRVFEANSVPAHPIGDFPNRHDPVPIRPQSLRLEMPQQPVIADKTSPLNMWLFGVAINGVPFDPSGPFWNGDGASGWQFEVLCPAAAVALGIDVNRAHTQGRGMYHYHGLPTGLLWEARLSAPASAMQLLGYAADGFPIYGPDAPAAADDLQSPTRRLRSSYRVRGGRRDSGPGGKFDGTFVEDFEYVSGSGDLDECNGRRGPTPEFPGGTYYYVLTDEFPYIPRQYRGVPHASFRHGPPPGVSPPVPPELKRYKPAS